MDRHKLQHQSARVELPASVRTAPRWDLLQDAGAFGEEGRGLGRLPLVAGLAGFVGLGALVVVTAALIALHVS